MADLQKVVNLPLGKLPDVLFYKEFPDIKAFAIDVDLITEPEHPKDLRPEGAGLLQYMHRNYAHLGRCSFDIVSGDMGDHERMTSVSRNISLAVPSWNPNTRPHRVTDRPGITVELLDAVSRSFGIAQRTLGYIGLAGSEGEATESDYGLIMSVDATPRQ